MNKYSPSNDSLSEIAHCAGFGQDMVNFTRINRKGTQPGRLTQTGQTKWVFYTMYHHAQFWMGELAGVGAGKLIAAQECAGHKAVRAAPLISLFVFCILLISIIVVTVCFVCCSVKLPLFWPTSFVFLFPFSSSPQQG